MTKELINLRIQDLIARGKQLEQEIQQINGALQQCQWTLAELEKTEDKPTVWSDDSGTEEEYDGYRWRDRDLCSNEPHYCKCYICVVNSLVSCKCSVCSHKRAVNCEILDKAV